MAGFSRDKRHLGDGSPEEHVEAEKATTADQERPRPRQDEEQQDDVDRLLRRDEATADTNERYEQEQHAKAVKTSSEEAIRPILRI